MYTYCYYCTMYNLKSSLRHKTVHNVKIGVECGLDFNRLKEVLHESCLIKKKLCCDSGVCVCVFVCV